MITETVRRIEKEEVMVKVFLVWMIVSFLFICFSMALSDNSNPNDKLSKLEIIAVLISPGMPIFVLFILLMQKREIRTLTEKLEKMEKDNSKKNKSRE